MYMGGGSQVYVSGPGGPVAPLLPGPRPGLLGAAFWVAGPLSCPRGWRGLEVGRDLLGTATSWAGGV